VVIPPEGLKWFSRIPADYYARANATVIGRVVKNGSRREIQLLGREITSDAKGAKIVWSK